MRAHCAPPRLDRSRPLPARRRCIGGKPSAAIASDAFEDGKSIPRKYHVRRCRPFAAAPLARRSPKERQRSRSSSTIPDAPSGTWTHWLLYNMPPGHAGARRGQCPTTAALGDGSRQGTNDFGKIGYGGPCPPPGSNHRYRFKLYALSRPIELEPGAKRDAVRNAIQKQKIAAEAELTGSYGR